MHLHEANGYRPAILKKGTRNSKPHYYLEYWSINPNGEWRRFRESYGVNQLDSLKQREKKLQALQIEINKKLPKGFPWKKVKIKTKKNINVVDGIKFALKLKLTTKKKQSHRTYNSKARILINWLRKSNLDYLTARQFKNHHAVDFMNFVRTEKKVGERTYNNYLQFNKGFFTVMKKSKFIKKNPFDGIDRLKPKAKNRKPLISSQKKMIVNYCRENHPMLFLAIVLIYYCFLRPEELRRLRIIDLDFESNVIYTRGNFGKNSKEQTITIPNSAVAFIKEAPIWDYPNHFLIFGKGIKPHPTKPCGERSINCTHREGVLDKLIVKGLLHSREGLSLYSWKDTGAMALLKKGVNIRAIQKALRHHSLEVTEMYLEALHSVNKEVLILENDLV